MHIYVTRQSQYWSRPRFYTQLLIKLFIYCKRLGNSVTRMYESGNKIEDWDSCWIFVAFSYFKLDQLRTILDLNNYFELKFKLKKKMESVEGNILRK